MVDVRLFGEVILELCDLLLEKSCVIFQIWL